MRLASLIVLLLAALGLRPGVARTDTPTAPEGAPKLVVVVIVDQMRADYVDRFRSDWTGGLARLLSDGVWFRNAAFPYLTTVTCPGHATVATGAFPRTHGIFQNAWYDRASRRVVTCTENPRVRALRYDGRVTRGGESSVRLRVPTFAEELRRQRGSRVVSLALKDRSAIMLAGKVGDAVTWFNADLDGWETSTAYSRGMVPAVQRFVDRHPVAADFGSLWTRLLAPDRYLEPDAAVGEAPPRGWTPLFPHPLLGTERRADATFVRQWERSPFADVLLGRMAAHLAEAFELGQRDTMDVLMVSFSSPDLVGHAFGPHSQEIRDIYARLDRVVGALFERLDGLVGRGGSFVVLSADHGVSTVPEQLAQGGHEAGRMNSTTLAQFLERTAQVAGPGRYVARVYGNDIYFEPGMYARLRQPEAALATVIAALERQPGIARVFRSEELARREAASSADALLRAAALSYVPGASGDLVLALKPGWMFIATGTTHGTANDYDQRVPILFMGPGIAPGVRDDAVTPADIAPTLAQLAGISLPQAEGRALRLEAPAP